MPTPIRWLPLLAPLAVAGALSSGSSPAGEPVPRDYTTTQVGAISVGTYFAAAPASSKISQILKTRVYHTQDFYADQTTRLENHGLMHCRSLLRRAYVTYRNADNSVLLNMALSQFSSAATARSEVGAQRLGLFKHPVSRTVRSVVTGPDGRTQTFTIDIAFDQQSRNLVAADTFIGPLNLRTYVELGSPRSAQALEQVAHQLMDTTIGNYLQLAQNSRVQPQLNPGLVSAVPNPPPAGLKPVVATSIPKENLFASSDFQVLFKKQQKYIDSDGIFIQFRAPEHTYGLSVYGLRVRNPKTITSLIHYSGDPLPDYKIETVPSQKKEADSSLTLLQYDVTNNRRDYFAVDSYFRSGEQFLEVTCRQFSTQKGLKSAEVQQCLALIQAYRDAVRQR